MRNGRDVIRALETMNLSVSKLIETTKDTEWDKCVFVRHVSEHWALQEHRVMAALREVQTKENKL